MNSLDVIRKLCDAVIAYRDAGTDLEMAHIKSDIDFDANLALSEAKSYLKTGGWRRWPEEKPKDIGRYITSNGAVVFSAIWTHTVDNPEDRWIGDWGELDNVTHWQPLPSLPKSEA